MNRNKKGYYIKLLSFILILGTVPVIIVGIFSFIKSSEIVQSNISKEKKQSIYQVQENIEQVLKTVDQSVTNFVMSYQLNDLLDEPLRPNQFALYRETKKELNTLQQFETGLEDILLINLDNEWMIRNDGLKRLSKKQLESANTHYFSLPSRSSWIIEENNILFKEDDTSSCRYSINLVKQLPLNGMTNKGLAIASIPTCYFNYILTDNRDAETTIILNENYKVVGHNDIENIGLDFSNKAYITAIESSKDNNGQYEAAIDKNDYNVTYRKSDYNGWTYLSFIKISDLNTQSDSIGWFTFFICIIMLTGLVIVSIIGSSKLYKPINKLAKMVTNSFSYKEEMDNNELELIGKQIQHMLTKNDELKGNLQTQKIQLKQFFMVKLLQGKVMDNALPKKLATFNFHQEWKWFSVLTLQIDTLEEANFDTEEEDLILFAINTIVEDLIPSTNRLTPIVMNQTQVTLFLGNTETEEEFIKAVTDITETIQLTVKQILNIPVSFGLSKSYNHLSYSNQAYRESKEALKYTLKYGLESVIFFDNLNQKFSFYTFYPNLIENELFDAIKVNDKQKVDERLAELLSTLFNKDLSYTQYEIAIVRFLNNLIELTEILGVDILRFKDQKSLFDQLYEFKTLPEVVDWFKNVIIYPMMNKVEQRTESQYNNLSDKMIHIIQQEFDSDLTLDSIAARLHYNPNYLSIIFRKETNTSFSEYLTFYRLEVAKKWLIETNMTVKEIAEKLKYTNSQNFIRSFRKAEGTTPGKYRDYRKAQ